MELVHAREHLRDDAPLHLSLVRVRVRVRVRLRVGVGVRLRVRVGVGISVRARAGFRVRARGSEGVVDLRILALGRDGVYLVNEQQRGGLGLRSGLGVRVRVSELDLVNEEQRGGLGSYCREPN